MMMRKLTGATVLGAVGVIALVAACGSSGTAGNGDCTPASTAGTTGNGEAGAKSGGGSDAHGDGGEPATSNGGGSDGGQGGSGDGGSGSLPSGAIPAAPGAFTASNLPDDLDVQVDEDFIINGETCGEEAHIDTDMGTIDCSVPGAMPSFKFKIVTQSDSSEVGVFAGKNIVIAPSVTVVVEGQRPLVLLAPGNVQINGTIKAIADSIYADRANAGGFSAAKGEQVKGQGPGGGSGTSTEAGGGGFCGKGGKGGSASGAPGGVAYGSEELVPLLGGSSGGNGATGGVGGAGGGAVQVIAGSKLTLSATGVIHVGGAGGGWNGGGGGSGGAILLEANEISIAGTLAANGGGGGEGDGVAGDSGLSASPDAVPAPSGHGTTTTDDDGGEGSAASTVDGSPGGSLSGGGGGGAGRIRLNSHSGVAQLTGVLSPAADSDCVSQGKLGG
jgi:hypothetical protein